LIYLDSSVALAQVLSENRRPPNDFWDLELISSRLLQYELWATAHRIGRAKALAPGIEAVSSLMTFVEMTPEVLESVQEGFGRHIRALDAIHLATMRFLNDQQLPLQLASYDRRMVTAAVNMGLTATTLAG
jgi:hypothetical protein